MIKDSGDRTEFETGAKRDMHAGKGREGTDGPSALVWHHGSQQALRRGRTEVWRTQCGQGYSAAFAAGQRFSAPRKVHGRNGRRGPLASSRILKCPFCNEHWIHKYIGNLDEYANPDEKLVAVKCGGCNAHFGIPTSNWNSMKECTIHNGEVLARCPRCGKDTFISEVSADE